MGNIMKKLSGLFFPDEDYDDIEDLEEEELQEEEEFAKPNLMPRFPSSSSSGGGKLINIDRGYSNNSLKVAVFEPTTFDEAPDIADSLKNKKVVVLNLEKMKSMGEKKAAECQKEIFDFINGAVYAIDGEIQKISDTIFVIAPPSVDIDSNIKSNETIRTPWNLSKAL